MGSNSLLYAYQAQRRFWSRCCFLPPQHSPTGNAGSKKLHFEELGIHLIPLGWKLKVRLRPAPHGPDDQKSSMNENLERAWEAP